MSCAASFTGLAGVLQRSTACKQRSKRCGPCQRAVVVAGSTSEQRQLFSLDSRHNLTMADVTDAYEVCSLIPDPNERHQCYSVFGIDAQRMSSYYDIVQQLEDQFAVDINTHALSQASHDHPHHPAITGYQPPPAAAAAIAVAMLWIASQHLVLF